MRQPLEEGFVNVSCQRQRYFPSQVYNDLRYESLPLREPRVKEKRLCLSAGRAGEVSEKNFGPIVDRVDLWVEVPQVDHQNFPMTRLFPSRRKISEKE